MSDDGSQGTKTIFYHVGMEGPLPKMGWWIYLRWVLLVVTILTASIGNNFIFLNLPTRGIFLICLPVILINAILHSYFLILKRTPYPPKRTVDRITYIQFSMDWVFIACLFHYTGGIGSPLLFYFLFHVILSSALLEGRACFRYVTLSAFTITFLALFELTGVIPHLYHTSFVPAELQGNPFFVLLLLFFFNTVLFISSYFVSTLFKQLRNGKRQLVGLQKKLEPTIKKLELLNKVAKTTSSTLGLKPRLDYVCHSISDLMGVKGVTLRLLDERTNKLELMSSCGLSDAYLHKGPVDADKSLARALSGEPHFVLDVAEDPSIQYPKEAIKEGIVSMLSFPLKGREKVIGTLRLYTDEKRKFREDEMDFLSALASQGAIYIENAKIYDVLKRQDEAKNEFIILTTHELKGPLMAIQGLLEVILKGYVGTLTQKQVELIERIEKRIKSVLSISTGLLDIYQWQSRGPDKGWSSIPLKKQIQRAADLFKAIAGEKGIIITDQLPDEELTLMGTEDDFEKILNNLITNAIKYTPRGGRILLALSATQSQIILKIKDTGIGIPLEDVPKIFNEFFRTKQARMMDPQGTGLGLPLVKRIIESLGGAINVNSEEGKGTEFIITFQRA